MGDAEVALAESMWNKAKHVEGHTQYRVEPVEAEWCTYKLKQWKKIKTAASNGTGSMPQWPHVPVDDCSHLGCKREGKRQETYTVDLKMTDSAGQYVSTYCTTKHGGWDVDQWMGIRIGMRSSAKNAWAMVCCVQPLT